MAAVRRTDDGLAAFGHLHSRFPLERNVANHFALAVPCHGRDKFPGLDLVPVTAGREHLSVDVVVTVHFEKTAGDRRRIALLRQIDDVIARRRRNRGAATGSSLSEAAGSSAAALKLRWTPTSQPSMPCSWHETPASRRTLPASDATTCENRE